MTEGAAYASDRQRGLSRLPRELYRSRGLLWDLIRKDVRVRYRYAALGFLWAILEPLALMAVLAFIFSFVLGDRAEFVSGEGAPPYAVFLLTGLLFWQFTAVSMTNAANAILDNRSLVGKVAFTREILPLASLGYPLINLGIGLVILLALHLLLGRTLHVALLGVPAVFLIQLAMTLGIGLFVAWSNAIYRDIGYMLSVVVLLGFYASPILYPASLLAQTDSLPTWAVQLYWLNPMAGLIESYRVMLFNGQWPDTTLLMCPLLWAIGAMVVGVFSFRRAAPTLSDHL